MKLAARKRIPGPRCSNNAPWEHGRVLRLIHMSMSVCGCVCGCVGAAFWHPYLIRRYCEIYVKPLSCSVLGLEMRTKNHQRVKRRKKC